MSECKQCFVYSDGDIKLCYDCLEYRVKELERLLSTVQVQYDWYHSIQEQTLKEIEQALKETKK